MQRTKTAVNAIEQTITRHSASELECSLVLCLNSLLDGPLLLSYFYRTVFLVSAKTEVIIDHEQSTKGHRHYLGRKPSDQKAITDFSTTRSGRGARSNATACDLHQYARDIAANEGPGVEPRLDPGVLCAVMDEKVTDRGV